MGQPELTLSTGAIKAPTGGAIPPEIAAAVAGQKPAAARQAAPRNRRPVPSPERTAALHQQQHDEHAAEEQGTQSDAADVVKPREDIETIELKLPDGRDVVFGPPAGVSLTARVAILMAGQPPSDALDLIARCCISVRSIDGQRPPAITSRVDVQKVANLLGDNSLDV